jgi:predicted porin
MKKHIIAAAVAAAVAVPAMAQVKVSGNIEAGFASVKANGEDGAAASSYTRAGVQSQVVGTPEVRFSGSEDLGGGLKANFAISMEYHADNGEVDDGSPDFGVTTVGLSGAFGSINIGKGTTRARDGGGLYRFFGNQGRLASSGDSASVSFNSSDERDGFVEFVSPTIQGFSVSGAYHGLGNSAAGARNEMGTAVSLRGALGPVNFQYGLERQTATQTANADRKFAKEWHTIAGNVNLGVAKVGVVYVENKSDAESPLTAKAAGVHVAAPVGKGLTIGGSFTDYTGNTAGASADVMALVAQYSLSKRTAVHTTYQTVKAGETVAGIGSSRGLNVGEIAGSTSSGFAVSVVHKF